MLMRPDVAAVDGGEDRGTGEGRQGEAGLEQGVRRERAPEPVG
jgi:hypothetical protein